MEKDNSQIEYTPSEKEALDYIEKVQYRLNLIKNSIKNNEFVYDIDSVVRQISRMNNYAIKDNMLFRALDKLDETLDYIKQNIDDNHIENINEVSNYVFGNAHVDGTLTDLTYQSELELLANYSLDEIIDYTNIPSSEKATDLVHIAKCEEILTNKLKEFCEDKEDKNKIMLACYKVLLDNDYILDEEHQKNYDRLMNNGREL